MYDRAVKTPERWPSKAGMVGENLRPVDNAGRMEEVLAGLKLTS